jgi:hypothetical protein
MIEELRCLICVRFTGTMRLNRYCTLKMIKLWTEHLYMHSTERRFSGVVFVRCNKDFDLLTTLLTQGMHLKCSTEKWIPHFSASFIPPQKRFSEPLTSSASPLPSFFTFSLPLINYHLHTSTSFQPRLIFLPKDRAWPRPCPPNSGNQQSLLASPTPPPTQRRILSQYRASHTFPSFSQDSLFSLEQELRHLAIRESC